MHPDFSDLNRSIPHYLDSVVCQHGSLPAVLLKDKRLTFADIGAGSDCVAAALCAQGVRKGDRIGLYCVNSEQFVMAYFGILKAGATVVTINLLLNPKEIAYMMNDSGAKALFYTDLFKDKVSLFREECPDLKLFIAIGDQKSAPDDHQFTSLLASTDLVPQVLCTPKDDVAVIIYTSGTTGHSKGAMLTHFNLIANVKSTGSAIKIEPQKDIFLVVLPMFHSFAGTVGMLTPLFNGCAIVPLMRFDPREVADSIAHFKATIFLGVPSMYNALLKLPDEYTSSLSSLKFGLSGGAAMPGEVMKKFEERFNKAIYEGDGPTECSPVTCLNPVDGIRKPLSVGLPIPDVEMSIRDDSGNELPIDEIGEICVRGPNIMKGYWNREVETRESMFEDWFKTGDLGTKDSDGYFSIVDRKKDMIIVNGMNVYPRMVEEVLYGFEQINEAAVVGEKHPSHGEIPVAYITFKEGSTATSAELRAFCLKSLGGFQVPKKFIIMKELPKTATGKILKRELSKLGEVERGIVIEQAAEPLVK